MGNGGRFGGVLGSLNWIFIENSQRRHTHDSAAALAVVNDVIKTSVRPIGKSGQTGATGSSPRMEFGNFKQPRGKRSVGIGWYLRMKPVQVSISDIHAGSGGNPTIECSGIAKEQAVSRKKRHLGIVADESLACCGVEVKFLDTCRTIVLEYFFCGEKLHGHAKRVSNGSAHKAASGCISKDLLIHTHTPIARNRHVQIVIVFQ